MRTIIINTMGAELRRNPLFFLPFREDQLFWLDRDLGGIGTCAEEITGICSQLDQRQDYRLVILADLAGYDKVDVDHVRQTYRELLTAYLVSKLVHPLAEELRLPPCSVSVVYAVTRQSTGAKGVEAAKTLEFVLRLTVEDQPVQALRLSRELEGGTRELLDLTDLFQNEMEAYRAKEARRQADGRAPDGLILKELCQNLQNRVENLQSCSYTPPGRSQPQELRPRVLEFAPQAASPELVVADLQLNLSEFVAAQVRDKSGAVELTLTPHTEADFAWRVRRALLRVQVLLKQAPRQTYYPLEHQEPRLSAGTLPGEIWEELLRRDGLLPGVKEAEAHYRQRQTQPDMQEPETPVEKLRRAWFLVGRERKLFWDLCRQLEEQYNPETVVKNQRTILDTCAQRFRQWRSQALSRELGLPDRAEATKQPEFHPEGLREELARAQQDCARISAEKLEDYEDVRQEAEKLKAGFRKASRLWRPDVGSRNTRNFEIYSLVLALVFLLVMLLPYVGITLGQSGVELSRYVHFAISVGVFAGLYFVGLLHWLHGQCRELHRFSVQMKTLIYQSGLRRQASIEAAVDAYSGALPRCTILHENLRELEELHKANQTRKDHYNAHIKCLERAQELLRELETDLQLPGTDRSSPVQPPAPGIAYDRPPSDPRNIPYYMLLSEKWGDKPC